MTEPQWYWTPFDDPWAEDPTTNLIYLRRLFEQPEFLTSAYSRAQVAQGLWFLAAGTFSGYTKYLSDPVIPWPIRKDTIASIPQLFRHLFAAQCGDTLGHLDRRGDDPLCTCCYMWWDIFPANGGIDIFPTGGEEELIDAFLAAMSAILLLPSEACQESALHGLGHAAERFPDRVKPIIDEFLARQPKISEELKQYALRAREGSIL
ncbi:MAG TPA: hypothetical protein VFW23_09065 [Tepidisphaeraceae bacterium]|nr:hypothetical protein [Tepidisphaeraceae bacterium]